MATLIPPPDLLRLYATGYFPMADEYGDIRLFSPDPRGILPIEDFHIPHGARKLLREPRWNIRIDPAFAEVLSRCADREETWINPCIYDSYCALHAVGFAHSVEVWLEEELVGGLYGVRVGGAFFGESMFHSVSGASKLALIRLVEILRSGGFVLLDTQWVTPHLELFGATEIPRKTYLRRLRRAISLNGEWPATGDWPEFDHTGSGDFPLA